MADTNPTVEAVLDALRRAPRSLARNPRAAVESAVTQLLRAALPAPATHRSSTEYRVDDLARAAGMTVRNVRAYQDRGLLHPPRRSGRVTLFNDTHLARLRLIGSMLDRGYSSAHILEMLSAWEHGKDLADVLGLEKALVTPWGHERPTTMTIAEARELAGGSDDLQRLIDADLVRLKGKRAVTERPKLLQVFAEMRTNGMPLNKLLELHEQVQAPIDEISRALVNAGAHHVAKQFEPDLEPTSTEVTELITTLVAFRTLAMTSVTASIGASIEHAVERVLGDYLAQLMASGSASENVS